MSSSRSMRRAAFSGDVDTRCSSSNHCSCSGVASGMNRQVNTLQNAGLLSPHPRRIRLASARRASMLVRRAGVVQPRRERAIQHEVRDALGVLHRVRNRDRAAAGDPEERKPIETRRVDHRFQIADPRVEAHIGDVALRHAIATLVVTDDAVVKRERGPPVPPDRAAPFEIEMRQPVRRLDERRSAADAGIGEAHAVARGAVPDFLPRLRR